MNDKLSQLQIKNESTDAEERYELYTNGGSRATLIKKGGVVSLNWQVYGPQYWPDAKVLMQGLLELSVIADQLSGDIRGKAEPSED
jgi:hypothetical protein